MKKKQQPIKIEPILIVQTIHSYWTKASRGAPGAIARNSVPECFSIPLKQVNIQGIRVLYHQIVFKEATNFKVPEEQISIDPTIHPPHSCIKVERIAKTIFATYKYHSGGGAPNRSTLKGIVKADVGNWVQIRENGRFSAAWAGDWWYQKIVVNAGIFDNMNIDSEHFLHTSPVEVFSAMADLW
ncbi:hypothetical protein [Chamaesiphon sp. VAR_48_metabat_135_sub]|uniref:hypothetical protein n=1 Tax=Chamaesiphon sp. VAR_48_metabat_135_sub TaxID=2964699 RepID=UPI00286D3EB5|nr:hypothetical protein [Chamaesiphon sp. VAR_48_metabat_135_sub]